jgi:hypothetical protein
MHHSLEQGLFEEKKEQEVGYIEKTVTFFLDNSPHEYVKVMLYKKLTPTIEPAFKNR